MQETVIVTRLGNGGAWVEGVQASACASCQARSGCGQESLRKLGRPVSLWLETQDSLSPGERVLVELPDGVLVESAGVLYGLPLIGLMTGAVLGQWIGQNELAALLTGVLGITVGLLMARRVTTWRQHRWQPRLVSRVLSHCPS